MNMNMKASMRSEKIFGSEREYAEDVSKSILVLLSASTLMVPDGMKKAVNLTVATSILVNLLEGEGPQVCQETLIDVCANVRQGLDLINIKEEQA